MKKSTRPKQQHADERTKAESVGKRSTNLVHEISRYYKPVLGREEPWSTGSSSADRLSPLPSVGGPQSNVPEQDVLTSTSTGTSTRTRTSRSSTVSSTWSTADGDFDRDHPRLERMSAKLACDQLKALLLNQRQEYRRKLALEKAKRRAVENLLLLKERPSDNASRSSASISTVDHSPSPLPQPSLDTTTTSTVSQSNKENSLLHSSGDSDRWREVTLVASRSTGQHWSASSIRSDHRSAVPPLQKCLITRRPSVVESIRRRQASLQEAHAYRKTVSAKTRQLAEHVALGLLSEEEAAEAMMHLPRSDAFLHCDLLRETRRKHRSLPERQQKILQARQQVQLATNRILARMYSQRHAYEMLMRKCHHGKEKQPQSRKH
ncbi:putative PI3/PI4-kinase family protein C1F5.11c [Trichinella spiralis]|uniref:PI3/PI4-kinase family protein C1F5.11c n=1 Tax=Trichinella spiralis TaxID=6334 RepID=A0ABR3KQ41_TRISP